MRMSKGGCRNPLEVFLHLFLSLSRSVSLSRAPTPCLSSTDLNKYPQILVRVDGEADPNVDVGSTRRSLPLALEGLDKPAPASASATEAAASGSAVVVFYRLLDPDAAVGQLKSKWSELVEPPAAAAAAATYSDDSGDGGSGSSGDGTPWARKVGVGI